MQWRLRFTGTNVTIKILIVLGLQFVKWWCHHLYNNFVVKSNLQVEFCCLHNALVLYLGFFGMQKFDEFKELVIDWGRRWCTLYKQGLWSNNYGWWDLTSLGVVGVWMKFEKIQVLTLVFSPFKMLSACIAQCA